MYILEKSVETAFSAKLCNCIAFRTGREPFLGGALHEKAVWVDEPVAFDVVTVHMWPLVLLSWSQKQAVAVLCDKMAWHSIESRRRVIPVPLIVFTGLTLKIVLMVYRYE